MGDYYQRTGGVATDGTPTFSTDEDRQNERSTAALVEAAFSCSVRPFGKLSPIDWYAERHGRVVGLLELKSRSHNATRYPTVFLNVRKWLGLQLGQIGMGVPSIFVVRFTDTVMWIPIRLVDASVMKIGGCFTVVKATSDVEPVIEIPVSSMRRLSGA